MLNESKNECDVYGNGNQKNLIWMLVVFAFLISGSGLCETVGQLERGIILDKVNCLADGEQSYALYLPRRFTPEKKWPLLFAFDPGGRARIPLQLFQRAAEKYGIIVVCPVNAKNGPWQLVLDAIRATFTDTRNRFTIDLNRIYTTGFSGGARAAAVFTQVVGMDVEGIIACGAGLPSLMKPEQIRPAFYHGIVGLEDFNYKELLKLGQTFSQIGIKHFIEIIDGDHEWPPEEICYRALEGMEIRAMRNGSLPVDAGTVDQAFESAMERAGGLEKSGNLYQAVQYYQYIIEVFSGFKALKDIQDKVKELQATKSFKKFAGEESKRNREELDFIGRFVGVFNTIKNYQIPDIDLRKIFNDLKIGSLNRQAEKNKDRYRRALARRLLRELELKGNSDGALYLEKGDTGRAIVFYEIAAAADNSAARAFYRLARIYAGLGKKGKALKNLKIAVDNLQKANYRDFSFLIKEKDLNPIKNEREYLELLRKVGLKQ